MAEFDAGQPGLAGLKAAWNRAAADSGYGGQLPSNWGSGARAFLEAEIWAQVCNQQQACDAQLTETIGMWRTFVHDRKAGLMSDGAGWDEINGGNPVELMLNGTWIDRYAEVTAESSAVAEASLEGASVGLRALSMGRRATTGLSKRPQQGGPCSFAGSTEVLMADGSLKAIDEVEVGDEVVATDPETGEQAAKRVSRVWVHRDALIALVLNADVDGDGRPDRLVTTEDHPFWNATDGVWQGPQDLDAGDKLVDNRGNQVAVLGLDVASTRAGWAYNLTVEDLHTYHVGASRILVHNTNGESCAIGTANPGRRVFSNLGPGDPIRADGFRAIDPSSLTRTSGRFNYIVGTDGRLVMANRRYGHIDLANGDDVLAAGEFRVVRGEVRTINNGSGHYKPAGPSARAAAEDAFRSSGLPIRPGAYSEIVR